MECGIKILENFTEAATCPQRRLPRPNCPIDSRESVWVDEDSFIRFHHSYSLSGPIKNTIPGKRDRATSLVGPKSKDSARPAAITRRENGEEKQLRFFQQVDNTDLGG